MMHDHVKGKGAKAVICHNNNHSIAKGGKPKKSKAHRVITAQGVSTEARNQVGLRRKPDDSYFRPIDTASQN
jgi:hypothetical protein